jgi:hypothetical protein
MASLIILQYVVRGLSLYTEEGTRGLLSFRRKGLGVPFFVLVAVDLGRFPQTRVGPPCSACPALSALPQRFRFLERPQLLTRLLSLPIRAASPMCREAAAEIDAFRRSAGDASSGRTEWLPHNGRVHHVYRLPVASFATRLSFRAKPERQRAQKRSRRATSRTHRRGMDKESLCNGKYVTRERGSFVVPML